MSAGITCEAAGARTWDVAVVGAGPAGALAGRQLARRGLSILLVDKAAFPRWKVCGCCLNGAALAVLRSVGLGELPKQLNAVPLTQARIAIHGGGAKVRLPGGSALSRTELDAALVRAAIDAGVAFLPETMVRRTSPRGATRVLQVFSSGREIRIAARVVLAASGLADRALATESTFRYSTERSSRIGVGTVTNDAPVFFESGTIYLAAGEGGYLGLVRLEDGPLDLAAAFDRTQMRAMGGPGAVAGAILNEVGWPVPEGMANLAWRGTLPLTRRPARLAEERLFIIGDAAGYVEPFTGEGMAWAAASAVAVAPLAAEAVRDWRPHLIRDWTRQYQSCVGRRQRTCRVIARALRHPLLVRTVLGLLARWPGLATPLVKRLNAAPHELEGVAS